MRVTFEMLADSDKVGFLKQWIGHCLNRTNHYSDSDKQHLKNALKELDCIDKED